MGKVKLERLSSTAVRDKENVVLDNPTCPVCGWGSKSRVSLVKYYLLLGGASINDIFPVKTSEEKQLMITGIHVPCQREMDKS